MPNKNTDSADYYRRENFIINAKDGTEEQFLSINDAKKKSRKLQAQGYKIVTLKPKPIVKGRYSL